jgi:hypothetical protein
MNLLKTPHQLLLEEAGATPSSPGLLHTPKQMLLQEAGVTPKFSAGGSISVNDMLAQIIAANQEPQKFKDGGQSLVKKLIMPGAIAGLLAPDIAEASQQAKEGKYGEAAGTAGLIASGFLPGPLQAILMGLYPTELGKGTLDEYYNERVPGSVLPARLKPENMK